MNYENIKSHREQLKLKLFHILTDQPMSAYSLRRLQISYSTKGRPYCLSSIYAALRELRDEGKILSTRKGWIKLDCADDHLGRSQCEPDLIRQKWVDLDADDLIG